MQEKTSMQQQKENPAFLQEQDNSDTKKREDVVKDREMDRKKEKENDT
jgi:hypothetical protein